jgi:hypothetical protein
MNVRKSAAELIQVKLYKKKGERHGVLLMPSANGIDSFRHKLEDKI